MRTTLAIDDANYERLQRAMRRRSVSFREVVNSALQRGLDEMEKPTVQPPFVVKPFPGGPRPGVNLDCIGEALSMLDDLDRR